MAGRRMRGVWFAELVERWSFPKKVTIAKHCADFPRRMWMKPNLWGKGSVREWRLQWVQCLGREGDRVWVSCHQICTTLTQPITSARITSLREGKDEALWGHQIPQQGIKSSCLSPSWFLQDSLWEPPFPFLWPPRSWAPPKYLAYVKTSYSQSIPFRNAAVSIFYWWRSWAHRGEVTGHDHIISVQQSWDSNPDLSETTEFCFVLSFFTKIHSFWSKFSSPPAPTQTFPACLFWELLYNLNIRKRMFLSVAVNLNATLHKLALLFFHS